MYVDDEWRVGEVERRLAGDARRAVVRAWRRRRCARRGAPPHRRRGARPHRDARRRHARLWPTPICVATLARLAIDCEVADLLVEPRGVGGGVRAAARRRGRRDASCSPPRRSPAPATGCVDVAGPPASCRRTTSTDARRVLRVLLPLRARHHHLRRHQRDPAQPRSPSAGSACRAALTGAARCARSPTSGSRPSSASSATTVRAFLPEALAPAAHRRAPRPRRPHRVGRGVRARACCGTRARPASSASACPPSSAAADARRVGRRSSATRRPTTTRRSSTPPRCLVGADGRRVRVTAPQREPVVRRRVRGHRQRVHRVHRGRCGERPVEHRDAGTRVGPGASCSTARRCW